MSFVWSPLPKLREATRGDSFKRRRADFADRPPLG